jgi:glycerophosphoryl diester phosphodiesterase
MQIIAHRGASGFEPENTIAAFQKAIDMGAHGIELDVHLSADGAVIVMHDETVDRTTNGTGEVNQLTLDELKNLTIGVHSIPTLEEVLLLINKKCMVNIELKGVGTAEPVLKLLQKYSDWNPKLFLVSSFDWNALQLIRRLNPAIPIGVLTATDLELAIGFAEFIKAETIHPYYHLLTTESTSQMQEKGFEILAWTVNDVTDIELIKSYNVNGIITDFPDRI